MADHLVNLKNSYILFRGRFIEHHICWYILMLMILMTELNTRPVTPSCLCPDIKYDSIVSGLKIVVSKWNAALLWYPHRCKLCYFWVHSYTKVDKNLLKSFWEWHGSVLSDNYYYKASAEKESWLLLLF